MANYVYHRVSTCEQDFLQQKHCIDSYLQRNGVVEADIKEQLIEKITGVKSHTHRKFARLLAKMKNGDTLYFSELSRIGRNMTDLHNIVNYCCENGIRLIQCKDGQLIENESIGGKALLFALSLAAEIEAQNIQQRTQMALDARKQILADKGSFVSKSGRVCTKLGRPKITAEERAAGVKSDNSAAVIAKQDAAIAWREQSQAVKFALRKRAEGWTLQRIVDEIGQLYDDNAPSDPNTANPYATPNGCKPQKGTVSKWLREANPLTLVG